MSDSVPAENQYPMFSLRGIYFRGTSSSLNDEFDPVVIDQSRLVANHRIDTQQIIKKEYEATSLNDEGDVQQRHAYVFVTRFEMRYFLGDDVKQASDSEDGEPADVVAFISADIACDYDVDIFPIEENVLYQWGSSNVFLHAWPYWREYCNSIQLKMGLPQKTVPLFPPMSKKVAPED